MAAIADNDTVATDDFAQSEATQFGVVAPGKSFVDTFADDGNVETIGEETYGGGQRARLEHEWQFDVTGGSTVTFFIDIDATTTTSEFVFEYSTDGVNWTTMSVDFTTTGLQSVTVNSGLSGTVFVRLRDTNRAKGDTPDSVSIDTIFFRSE
jgi:hypothetical protein